MGALNLAEWQTLPISLSDLCINTTLRCGQSFRWRKNDAGVWSIALHNRILSLYQHPDHLYYRTLWPSQSPHQAPPTPPSSIPPSLPEDDKHDDTLDLLHHYFNLSLNSKSLYDQWSTSDPNFAKKAPKFTGIRILNQDAWEALIAFICSSNNNISRISQMVHKLCTTYGPLLGHLDDLPHHDFPTPHSLAQDGVETTLRSLGFGYRAKYIAQTARLITSKDPTWLDSLRNPSPSTSTASDPMPSSGRPGYRAAHTALLSLQGVGPKVADCVCLMGLGWSEAIPVDTHVWQIAQRDYKFGKGKQASLTKGMYEAIGEKFRELWGAQCGWAQSVLFTANLRGFAVEGERRENFEVKKEEVRIKLEGAEGETVVVEDVERRERILVNNKGVKREVDEAEGQGKVVEVKERLVRSKRRRGN